MDYLGRNLGGHITPCPRHVRHDAVAMAAMLKNILNALTLLPMDRLWRNLGVHIPSCSRHPRHDVVAMAMATAYQRRIWHSAVMGVRRPNAWTNFHEIRYTSMLGPQWQSRDQIFKFWKFKMADSRHVGKYWKYRNSPSNGPIGTKLGWSHPITFPTCPPKWGCHGDGHCLVMALWTFSSYGRLEAERVYQFWWNLVYYSKFRQQWQSCDQILKVKIQNGGRSLLESIWNAITLLRRNLGGRIPSCSQYWKCYNSSYDWLIGTTLGWSHPSNTSAAKPIPWYLVVIANRTVNFLVLWDVEIRNIHNFDETVPLWYKKYIKSGRKTANINTKKTLEVLLLLRLVVHDTSKRAKKITRFILVLHWAMDVIYDFYYIHGPMEY